MNLYFAPLEGITTCIYRNTHREIFGGCDAYFAPFITPSDQERISRKGLRDVLPERNPDQNLKVQVLTHQAEAFLKFAKKINAYGYEELNMNLGCPFPGVVNKGRGAGLLQDQEGLDRLLYEIFSKTDIKISVKTRSGFASGAEMDNLMAIYNQYPVSLLIIHPRAREDFYFGTPDDAVFSKAYAISKNRVCYNGNIESREDFEKKKAQFPDLEGIMIGRGAIKNPALFREIRAGKKLTTEELLIFSNRLLENYYEELRSETFTLQKMKEVWAYMMQNYPEEKKIAKQIKKAGKFPDFVAAISSLPEIK